MTQMSLSLAAAAILLLWSGGEATAATTKVACVGDSITVGARASTPAMTYPALLGARLGAAYDVHNFGVGGTTLMRSGDAPYVNRPQYDASGAFAPDLVVIMLGTNDSKPPNWSKSAGFDADYQALVKDYAMLPSHPRMFVVLPPPCFGTNPYNISAANIENGVVPAIRKVAAETGASLIDVFAALGNDAADFPDNVHPNDAGNAKIAGAVYLALTAAAPVADAAAADTGAAAPDDGSRVAPGDPASLPDAAPTDVAREPAAADSAVAADAPVGTPSAPDAARPESAPHPGGNASSGCMVAGVAEPGTPCAMMLLALAIAALHRRDIKR